MYLGNIIETQRTKKLTLRNSVLYWEDMLFNIVSKMFTWEGLSFKQKHIETPLILYGKVGIISLKGEVTAVRVGGGNGMTKYPLDYQKYNWSTSNGLTGEFTVDSNGILMDNNSLRNATYEIIQRYAIMLAHTELSLMTALVNGRSNKMIVASNQKMADSVRSYQDKIFNGNYDTIVDPSFLGLSVLDQSDGQNPINFAKVLWDVRQSILYAFYEDLGIKKNQQKRERLVTDEVNADIELLKLNIQDMYDARLEGCEKVNNMFGTSWSVKCNIDYDNDNVMEEGDSDEV